MKLNLIVLSQHLSFRVHLKFLLLYFQSLSSLSHPHSQTNSVTLSALQFQFSVTEIHTSYTLHFTDFLTSTHLNALQIAKLRLWGKQQWGGEKGQISSKYRNLSRSLVSYVQRKESLFYFFLKEESSNVMSRIIKGAWRRQVVRCTWQGSQELPTTNCTVNCQSISEGFAWSLLLFEL